MVPMVQIRKTISHDGSLTKSIDHSIVLKNIFSLILHSNDQRVPEAANYDLMVAIDQVNNLIAIKAPRRANSSSTIFPLSAIVNLTFF